MNAPTLPAPIEATLEQIRGLLDQAAELADGLSNDCPNYHRASTLSFLPDRINAARGWAADCSAPLTEEQPR